MDKKYHIETDAIHAGQEPDPSTGAIMTPIYQTSTYVQKSPGEHQGYEYSRTGNPTRTAFESLMAALEGGMYGLAFSSGMAATDTIMRLFKPGDHTIVGNDVYGGTYRLFDKVLRQYGLEFSFVDVTDPEAIEAAIQPNTRLIWLETPTNPMLRLADIRAISMIAASKSPKIWVAVDNTFASPYLQQPLSLGADMVVHSTTKYLGGHSDVVGGAVVLNDEEAYLKLKFLQNAVGAVPGPQDAWLTMRGIKTLHLRMERHSENAMKVAQFLSDHSAIAEVYYPGLESHPQHDLAKRQMPKGYGGMISVIMVGGRDAGYKFVSQTRLFALAESLGGVESLIEHPGVMTHASTSDSTFPVPASLVRLSVGVEHIDDLLEDLQSALVGL
ncbi:MAG: putative cystathionine gamma-synthase [Chloroflexota bacterium]|nr:cystathionine gamma-synthase [Chloroflexota bacterium]NOG64936.1 cystathionine gamma-synthase [Chloroflexota bacterium]GIK66414.1 MAG: putative cystathionine gamma-synthase [Chloroflexota bacterium]